MTRGPNEAPLLEGEESLDLDAAMTSLSALPVSRQETIRTMTKQTSKLSGPLTPAITSPFIHRPRQAEAMPRPKAQQRRLTHQVVLSCVIMFTEGFYATQLFPYGPWMTEVLRGNSHSIGTYTGLLYTAQSFGMLATAYVWANISNKYGRRPCLLAGLSMNLIITFLLSICTNYWGTIALRLWSGMMNSNLSIMRTSLRESFQHEDSDDTWAFSTLSVAFGASSVAGPSYGGLIYGLTLPLLGGLQQPWTMGMLTCTAFYAACLVITALLMPETAFLHERQGSRASVKAAPGGKKPPSLMKDVNFILLAIMGGGHSYIFTGWEVTYPLIARLPASALGEHWSTASIGLTFLIGSLGLMAYSLVIYPRLATRLSVIRIWCLSAVPALLAMVAFPRLLALFCGMELGGRSPAVQVLNYGTQVLVSMLLGSGFISIQLLLNSYVTRKPNSAPLLAVANSILVSTQALVRAVSPMSSGALFTVGLQAEDSEWAAFMSRALPFDHLALVGFVSLVGCGLLFDRRAG